MRNTPVSSETTIRSVPVFNSVAVTVAPIFVLLFHFGVVQIDGDLDMNYPHPALLPLMSILGIVLLTITLHLARGLGNLHGLLAKNLHVSTSRTD